MLNLLRNLFRIVVLVIAIYSIFTRNSTLMPYLMLFLGVFMFLTGWVELRKGRKKFWGYMSIIVALFAFFVSIQGFLLK